MADARDNLTPQTDGIAVDSLPKWLRDLIDINNEMADRDTGRVKRFLASGDDDGPDSEKRRDERRFSALMRLLQDPEYARLYTEAANFINDAGDAAERALRKLGQESEVANARLEDLRSAAAELPDGRKVFRGADGRLYAEDGSDVTDQKNAVRGLSSGTASWEEYKRAKDALDDIERRRREIEEYQRTVLDPARRRLADPDNPPSKEELEDILRRAKQKMPPAVRAEYNERAAQAGSDLLSGPDADLPDADTPAEESGKKRADAGNEPAETTAANSSAADEYVPAKPVKAPDAFAQFRAASSVLGDDPFGPTPSGPKVV